MRRRTYFRCWKGSPGWAHKSDSKVYFQIVEDRYSALIDHLDRLVARGEAEEALRLANALSHFWWSREYQGGWEWLGKVLEVTGSDNGSPAQIEALCARGRIGLRVGRARESAELFVSARDKAEVLEDRGLILQCIDGVALVHIELGELSKARELLERTLAGHVGMRNWRGIADSLDGLGIVALNEGRYSAAADLLRESIAIYKDIDDLQNQAWVHNDLARVGLGQGDFEFARLEAKYALRIGEQLADHGVIACARNCLGVVAEKEGEELQAQALLSESLEDYVKLGDPRPAALTLESFALLAARREQWPRVIEFTAAAERIRNRLGSPRTEVESSLLAPSLHRAGELLSDSQRSAAEEARRSIPFERATELGEPA